MSEKYPSATATGILIGILFGKEEIIARGDLSTNIATQSELSMPGSDHESAAKTEPVNEVGPADTGLPWTRQLQIPSKSTIRLL